MVRVIASAALALTGLLAWAGPAHAGAVDTTHASAFPTMRTTGQMIINATGGADDIRVGFEQPPGRYVVSDPAGVEAGENCAQMSATEVRCPRLGGWFGVGLAGGDDTITLTAPQVGSWAGSVRGETGKDRMLGSGGRNTFDGGQHADVLKGRGNDDRLYGQLGSDLIRGGAGRDRLLGLEQADRIEAADGTRDRIIDCGEGNDVAVVDRKIDPPTQSCERVVLE